MSVLVVRRRISSTAQCYNRGFRSIIYRRVCFVVDVVIYRRVCFLAVVVIYRRVCFIDIVVIVYIIIFDITIQK